jgi:DNA-binding CsgD family transcriptional regulator/tetratricopeptide (TPR) repeat protein
VGVARHFDRLHVRPAPEQPVLLELAADVGTVPQVLVGRPGLSPVMVGRSAELARLRSLAASGSDPRVALVSGEAGTGKTRLVQELLSGLGEGPLVLAARAEQGAMGRPFALFLEAVSAGVSDWDSVPPDLAGWEDALGTLLRPIAPGLGAEERPYASDELIRAAGELVRYLAAGSTVVCVFEDLHWADADSLGLFQRLSVTTGLDVLLLGTFRPEDLDRRHLADLLSSVERNTHVEHVNIKKLGVREVASLISAIRSTGVHFPTAAALHGRTGGNPFFLEELLVAAGDTPTDELAEYPLPRTLTEALLGHLDGLDEVQRRTVDAASILGERIPFDLLTSVTGLSEEHLLDTLRVLVDRGLVVEESTDLFSFRHALTREAVAGRLLGRERRRLHEKALTSLEETGSDDWAALAHHAHEAGRLDEMVAAARKGAASYLRQGATYQALRLAELALSEGEPDDELLELATRASWSVGLLAMAVDRAEQWRSCAAERNDYASLAGALRILARLRWETENPEAHRRAVDEALGVADRLPPGEDRAWISNLASEAAMLVGEYEAAVALADEAIALAGPAPSEALRASVLVNKGSALLDTLGAEGEGERLIAEGLRIAIAAEDHQSALRALNNLSHYVMPVWDPPRTRALLEQMRETIVRTGREDWWDNWAEANAIFLAHVVGDLDAARAALTTRQAVRGWRWMAMVDGELSYEAGDFERAERLFALAREEPRPRPAGVADVGFSLGLSARVAARLHRTETVKDLVTRLATEIVEAGPIRGRGFADCWHGALVAACRSGLSAQEVLGLQALLSDPPLPGGHLGDPAWPVHLRAAIAELDGELDEAVALYSEAVKRGTGRSVPAHGDALTGLARTQMLTGDHPGALRSAEQAHKLLANWSSWRRDEADALVRRLRSPGPGSGEGELTPRELEVASLVSEGASNGEIGKRLYISTKTASVHVSAILRKLGLQNRSEIAAWATRKQLGR